jgi:sec-independent protein translocase protein TatA
MPNIGPMELIIVLVIALVVLGPKRLPDAGKSLGRGIREFKDSISGDNKDDDVKDERRARELAAIQPVAVEPATEERQTEPVA